MILLFPPKTYAPTTFDGSHTHHPPMDISLPQTCLTRVQYLFLQDRTGSRSRGGEGKPKLHTINRCKENERGKKGKKRKEEEERIKDPPQNQTEKKNTFQIFLHCLQVVHPLVPHPPFICAEPGQQPSAIILSPRSWCAQRCKGGRKVEARHILLLH
jgi:hypothetical protein